MLYPLLTHTLRSELGRIYIVTKHIVVKIQVHTYCISFNNHYDIHFLLACVVIINHQQSICTVVNQQLCNINKLFLTLSKYLLN